MLGPRSSLLVAAVLIAVAVVSAPAWPASAPPAHQWEAAQFVIEPLNGPLLVNGSAYRGRFDLRADGGNVRLVNDVKVEDYVRGIREMPPSWPIEAQRAQAIAARSYALHQALVARKEGRPSDLCATAACQVYGGIAAEEHGGPGWARATESTAAQVVAFRGAPILAMYSSSNGGRSVAASKPYLRSVPDPDDASSPHHRWSVEVPETAIGAAVALPVGADLTDVERDGGMVVATWEGPSPDAEQTARPMPVAEFRTRLEAAHPPPPGLPRLLPSTAFALAPAAQPGNVVIEGRGWGHGVGMSQHGALGKARRGWDARQILAAYYAGLTPVTAQPGQMPDTLRVDVAAGASLDLAGQGAFRVLADGVGVATGNGESPWKIAARKGRLVLSAPDGWTPPQPAGPPVAPDPFEAAASAPPSAEAAAPRTPAPKTSTGPVGGVAVALLAGVTAAAFALRDRPDPVALRRG